MAGAVALSPLACFSQHLSVAPPPSAASQNQVHFSKLETDQLNLVPFLRNQWDREKVPFPLALKGTKRWPGRVGRGWGREAGWLRWLRWFLPLNLSGPQPPPRHPARGCSGDQRTFRSKNLPGIWHVCSLLGSRCLLWVLKNSHYLSPFCHPPAVIPHFFRFNSVLLCFWNLVHIPAPVASLYPSQ